MNCTFNVLKLHVKDELSKDEEEKISNSVTSFANKKEGNDEHKKASRVILFPTDKMH